MRIFAFSLIKNEEDIIEKNLLAASEWAHKIFVYDNGSTDSTWEIVNRLKNDKIIPYKSDPKPYRDTLRSEIFNHYKGEFQEGDWICIKLDSDEFYLDNPREFVNSLSKVETVVYGLNVEYQFTNSNINDDEFNFENFNFAKIQYCEQRFVKYRIGLNWPEYSNLPIHPGPPSKRTIKFAHYQFRTVPQIQKRLNIRNEAIKSGHRAYWEADLMKSWETKVVSENECFFIPYEKRYEAISTYDRVKIPENYLKITIKKILYVIGIW